MRKNNLNNLRKTIILLLFFPSYSFGFLSFFSPLPENQDLSQNYLHEILVYIKKIHDENLQQKLQLKELVSQLTKINHHLLPLEQIGKDHQASRKALEKLVYDNLLISSGLKSYTCSFTLGVWSSLWIYHFASYHQRENQTYSENLYQAARSASATCLRFSVAWGIIACQESPLYACFKDLSFIPYALSCMSNPPLAVFLSSAAWALTHGKELQNGLKKISFFLNKTGQFLKQKANDSLSPSNKFFLYFPFEKKKNLILLKEE